MLTSAQANIRVRILHLTLPFLLRDLISPEVQPNETIKVFLCTFVVQDIVYDAVYYLVYNTIYDTTCQIKFEAWSNK